MPSRTDGNPARVLISGLNHDRILDCIEKLRALEDEFLEDYASHNQYHYQRPKPVEETRKPQQVEITGGKSLIMMVNRLFNI